MENKHIEMKEIKNGWIDEKSKRGDSALNFLSSIDYKDYSPRELHFSGGNMDTLNRVASGIAEISELKVLYSNNEIEQIHVAFTAEMGGILDVYIQGSVLKDYLREF
ncbi:MAG: hypothetical protein PHH83_01595 [Patescibacteria group bacterium]|nr:hypothetical protein [Patescibacteria group bacterium]